MYPQRSVMTCGLATALEPPHFNHAPVRGATPAPDLRIRGRVVSIHAPAWGATRLARRARRSPFCFNPRTRVGCDLMKSALSVGSLAFQSTHPRGVRRLSYQYVAGYVTFQSTHPRGVRRHAHQSFPQVFRGFNPRTRVGCDVRSASRRTWPAMFQSTHPRGVRPFFLGDRDASLSGFNPRTRVGCDCFHVLSSRFP